MNKLNIYLVVAGFLLSCSLHAQVEEPYRPLRGGHFSGVPVPASPDPMVSYRWDDPRAGDSLQTYLLKPVSITGSPRSAFILSAGSKRQQAVATAEGTGVLLENDTNVITVRGKGSLRMDFGIESAGWLEFDSDDLPDSVTMSISEYNEPAIVNIGAQHPVKTEKPVKYGHTYRLELNTELYEGVRFGWIHIRNFSRTWHIRNPRLICQAHPVNYKGSFSCSDPLLTRIWYTGAYTVRLNSLQHFFGAILMERSDRQSWTGDAYPAQAAALAAFGNYDFIRGNIRITAGQDNGIASYPLYWVLSLIDYYRYSGDSAFFREYIANADKKLGRAYHHYDSLPSLGFMGWDERLGAGFENTQVREAQNTYRMLCIHAWKKMATVMRIWGDTLLAAKYEGYAASKSRDLVKSDPSSFGIHAVSEAVNAGLSENPVIATLSEKWFSDRLNRLSYSPFNQYFIIQAMASARRYEAALGAIRDCWGGQLLYGGTSFFEVYRPSWNAVLQKNDPPPNNQCGYTSLAHPWGAGVTKWLSENILGIRPLSPGFGHFEILPYLDRSLTRVKGEMPTPSGPIAASFDSRSGDSHIIIPAGLFAERIGIPRAGRILRSVTVNGKLLWHDGSAGAGENVSGKRVVASRTEKTAAASGPGSTLETGVAGKVTDIGRIEAVGEDSQFIYLLRVQPGNYSVKCTYRETRRTGTPVAGTSGFAYPIKSFVRDSVLSGQWKKRYGRDGYELFGYDSAGTSLPAYVTGVEYRKNGVVVWDSSSVDPRVLMPPGMNQGKAAAIITKDPEPTYQTFTIDVTLKNEHPYWLSLYFLDWRGSPEEKGEARRTAVELFDLETLNILAPVEIVKDYAHGRWVRFRFNKSVRIRIDQVRGKNAAVSGLFFDPE